MAMWDLYYSLPLTSISHVRTAGSHVQMCTCTSGQRWAPWVFLNCVSYGLRRWSLSLNLEFTNKPRPNDQQAPKNILSHLNSSQQTQLNKLHTDSSSKSFLQHSLESLLRLSGKFLRSAPQAAVSLAPTVLGKLSCYLVYLLSSWSSEMEPMLKWQARDSRREPPDKRQGLLWPDNYGASIHTRTSGKVFTRFLPISPQRT